MADDSVLGSTASGAAQGGASGGWVGAGVGAGLGLLGGLMGSSAAKKAAKAQQDAASRWEQFVGQQEKTAMDLVGTPAQMAAHDQALQSQERQVQRQEQLAATINPALIEQGKQYMQLLQGQSAPVLKNLQDQRARQRQDLVGQLHQQLGPGAETSTAGMQALNQFDQETSNHLSQAQMQYTGMLGGMSLQAPGAMNAAGGANMQLSEINAQGPNNQKANLIAQFTGARSGPMAAQINAAGGQYAGQALQGQTLASLGNNLMKFGAASMGNDSLNQPDPYKKATGVKLDNAWAGGSDNIGTLGDMDRVTG